MVDLKDDRNNNQQTIVAVGEDIGSWSVIVDDGTIVSKQTRTGTTTYDMECWDIDINDWQEITYNPYLHKSFVLAQDQSVAVREAWFVEIRRDGVWAFLPVAEKVLAD